MIHANSACARTYSIDGIKKTVQLKPRIDRWNGALGGYLPRGDSEMHLVLQEGLQFFESRDDLQQWLRVYASSPGQTLYTSGGLVVRWDFVASGNSTTHQIPVLSVDVFQLLLLAGASDQAFTIDAGTTGCVIGSKRESKFVASEAKTIGGRRYSGWVIDVMNHAQISPAEVELSLQNPTALSTNGYRTYVRQRRGGESSDHSFTVTTDELGRVVFMTN
jgi:hypothetical protein